VVGRASPSGPLDNIIVRKGRWATRPGEIVIDPNQYGDATIGGTVTVTSAPGQPKLTVVGLALSVTEDQEAWVVPSQLAALRAKGAPVQEQMLYTFTHAATTGQVSADLAELKAALPAGAVTNSVSWLDTEGTSAARTGTAHLATGQAIHMTVGGATVTAKITGQVYAPGPLLGALLTSEQTFTSAHASLPVRLYQALIRPGTGQQKYQAALSRALGPGFTVIVQGVGIHGVGLYGLVDTSLIRLLTILVAVLAGLGVLNSVLMLTRERVHDLGIFKAVGMTPRRPSSWSPAGSSSPPSLPRSSPCPPGWPCKTRLSTPSPGASPVPSDQPPPSAASSTFTPPAGSSSSPWPGWPSRSQARSGPPPGPPQPGPPPPSAPNRPFGHHSNGQASNQTAARSAGRRAFSCNISITQCDAVCQLAGYPAGHGRSRPALNGGAHASAACASLFGRVHESCDLAKQLRPIGQKHRSKAETETNK